MEKAVARAQTRSDTIAGKASKKLEPLIYHGQIKLPYTYYLGAVASRFYRELRDSGQIMALKCTICNRTYVPPRSTCGHCFSKLEQWVKVGPAGTLLTFTEMRQKGATLPHEAPVVFGVIQLDGADTGLLHYLGEVQPDRLKIGMRVVPVLKDVREGNILDIRYFKPL